MRALCVSQFAGSWVKLARPTLVAAALMLQVTVPAIAAATVGAAAAEPYSVLINPGDEAEQSRFATFSAWKSTLEQSLRPERGAALKVTPSTDASADLSATRARLFDVFVAPAHVIGSAVRYGYVPVASIEKPVQAVLVAFNTSPVSSLESAAGKRLGLPQQDSVVTYLLRGELNAANTTVKRHFSSVVESRYQDALLICLQIKRCDVVAVERAVFERWVAAGEPLKVVMQSKAVPGMGVALKPASTTSPEALRAALAKNMAAAPGAFGAQKLQALAAKDFDYVSTLGYFTPRSLPGATVVDAATVAQLQKAGALLFDTRNDVEFKAGHIAGASLLPYGEKSAKDADFKAADDSFDISKLPANKATPLVFACNGAECWKSFKASHAALKAGYSKVYWFRGGFPEWRSANLPVAVQ
ncbi:PhnD/SsuA/transferrin family substrate-binding protein [Paucibacter sp. TC2R-5]|uniref:rhodanese-like domain-containing protein n=1 Tax=Paucibacter sp. TC2R-5 TaxID=2893555 RepID=UPI0021E493CB|nr:rhodanese-like domain-containing protein [Paucibacter sp. TC2R-5]MCV2361500.1 PhnD/SsuA/transferrin family substrate-binding protein [Paucibacter sp. TC2R-5]